METVDFLDFLRLVVKGNVKRVADRLSQNPLLAKCASSVGASRQESKSFFFEPIAHYLYEGDTALHTAAAAFSKPMAEILVAHGADFRARNRMGAQPLHYAADANHWDPEPQAEVIAYLASVGAEINAVDKSGVTPLHRAIRTRSALAVKALLESGASPRQPNKSGSTPLHLAVQPTGRGGTGSDEAREQQDKIIKLLLEHGANQIDQDASGKTAYQAATSEWIRLLLN